MAAVVVINDGHDLIADKSKNNLISHAGIQIPLSQHENYLDSVGFNDHIIHIIIIDSCI